MKSIKEIFNNVRTKVKESKIATFVKNGISKISEKTKGIRNIADNFSTNHQNVKNSMAGDVSSRFSTKIKKFFKDKIKSIQTKANNGSKFAKFMTMGIKVLSIISTIAFAVLVIYYIKDVFLNCLLLVAMCAATAISIEFILSILSIATGCKI
jgi:hypothetical protein